MDPRVEGLVKLLLEANLDAVPSAARETVVAAELSSKLGSIKAIPPRAGIGIDGSRRRPDDARQLAAAEQLGTLDIAIEYKLYRDRKQAAGEIDRGLGQCIAYAEQYQAVLVLLVYMGEPRDSIPKHWLDRSAPLRVGHAMPGVPVYFVARPRSWSEPWAGNFAQTASSSH